MLERDERVVGQSDLDAIKSLVRSWGSDKVRPHLKQLEDRGEFPRDLYRQMGRLGLFSSCFADDGTATGRGFQELAEISEQVAWVYPPLSGSMNLQAATVPLTIANWGSRDLANRYVPGLVTGDLIGCNAMTEPDGGSDLLGAMRTRAVRHGADYIVNGSKMWITNANVADVAVLYAKTDPEAGHKGVTAFVLPMDTPGITVTRVKTRGLGSLMPTNAITFDDVRVPGDNVLGDEGRGFSVAMNAMDFGRLTVGARSVGLAQACLDASLEYANQRTAFGQKIGEFQLVKKQLADMTVEVEAARLLVKDAAVKYDAGEIATRASSIAKYYGGEVCNRAAQAATDIFGGAAFSDELPISIYLNYAKLYQNGEGSANIQAGLIADDALGWRLMNRHRLFMDRARS